MSARRGCDEVMFRFGFPWPEALECSNFPEPPDICVGENNTTAPPPTQARPFASKPATSLGSVGPISSGSRPESSVGIPAFPEGTMDLGFVCPAQFKVPKGFDYALKVGDKVVKDCAAPCQGMFFTPQQITYSRLWVGSWSALCLLSCLFTVLTFLIDTERFRYPERPIVFLSLCYLMVAASYLAGAASGETASCRKPFPAPVDLPSLQMVSTVTQGTKHEPCTILFMLLYFFGMASSIWWVVLTLTWFLAAGLKWGHEAIEANCQYFHLAAWAVPAVKTITILAMGKVEGKKLFLWQLRCYNFKRTLIKRDMSDFFIVMYFDYVLISLLYSKYLQRRQFKWVWRGLIMGLAPRKDMASKISELSQFAAFYIGTKESFDLKLTEQ
ncbi:unnamed protein product [Nesidiocoris tenuis]|uniref:G-protein coupled receptors family 2 profile 2 domain-containing protein n=1 Tax=Nesidiocoris tenuis TaxID=355587 RepID=A0A6H5GCA6_9HEMI|nr:unnamed protein product [Nesidiocoris tenuis]